MTSGRASISRCMRCKELCLVRVPKLRMLVANKDEPGQFNNACRLRMPTLSTPTNPLVAMGLRAGLIYIRYL